jgi:hypothetical protein
MFTLIYCRPFFRSRTQVHAAARVVRCLKLDIRFLRLCLTTLSIIRVAGCKSAKVVHLSNWLSGNPMLAHMGRTCARYRFWGCWDTCPIRVISRGGKIPAAQMTLMADENNYGRCKCSVVACGRSDRRKSSGLPHIHIICTQMNVICVKPMLAILYEGNI